MKKITKIEAQKNSKDRVSIFINDQFAFGLDLSIMMKYSLMKGKELEEDFIQEVLLAEEEVKAYNYAISILSRSARSEKEIRLKMKEKGYDHVYIDSTIQRLLENKYIDDDNYSELFIKDKINFSKDGKRKIKEALYNKGVDRETIENKIEEIITEKDELERAFYLAEKKIKSLQKDDNMKKKNKLYGFLSRKGFDFNIINKVINKLMSSNYDEFDDDLY